MSPDLVDPSFQLDCDTTLQMAKVESPTSRRSEAIFPLESKFMLRVEPIPKLRESSFERTSGLLLKGFEASGHFRFRGIELGIRGDK